MALVLLAALPALRSEPPGRAPSHATRATRPVVRAAVHPRMDGFEQEVNPGAVAGTDLRILEYPHPLLRAANADVVDFDYGLKKLTKEMFSIMYASRGVGLACAS